MSDFKVGNCVGLKREFSDNKSYWHSVHILSKRDISLGFYLSNDKFNVIYLHEVIHRKPNLHVTRRCQTSSGKVTQAISFAKFMKVVFVAECKVVCYIKFKGESTKVEGSFYKGQVYFMGMNNIPYKTKVFLNKDGYLQGMSKDCLGVAQQRRSTYMG